MCAPQQVPRHTVADSSSQDDVKHAQLCKGSLQRVQNEAEGVHLAGVQAGAGHPGRGTQSQAVQALVRDARFQAFVLRSALSLLQVCQEELPTLATISGALRLVELRRQ